MSLSEEKIIALYNFYLENGFDHTVEEVCNSLKISHKTFFNRYKSKENSIEIAWNYWLAMFEKKWERTKGNCNTPVEELVMFLYAIKKSKTTDSVYYEHALKDCKFKDEKFYFKSAVVSILTGGRQKFHISDTIDIDLYADFLLTNIFLIDYESPAQAGMLTFALHAALTERGMELLSEIPFANS